MFHLQVLWRDINRGVSTLCCSGGLGASWTQQCHVSVEQRLLQRLVWKRLKNKTNTEALKTADLQTASRAWL